ncbi:MAG: hypothetical protein ACI4DU_01435 [Lachnospiraceae bacterium]
MFDGNAPSLSDIAAVTRDGDGWGGNSAWVLIILFALIFGWGGNGFGGRNAGEAVTEAGLCNSMNFNNLENAVGRLNDSQAAIARQTDNAICQLGYQNAQLANLTQRDLCQGFAAVNAGINQSRFDAQQCCCETQRAIDGTNYNIAQSTAAINANTTAQVQKILDAITGNRMADMQNQINHLQLQAALCGVIRYPNQTTYTAGYSPCFNGYNQGCGCC